MSDKLYVLIGSMAGFLEAALLSLGRRGFPEDSEQKHPSSGEAKPGQGTVYRTTVTASNPNTLNLPIARLASSRNGCYVPYP